ncbi:MAG TPA: hypothetical protein VEZ91_11980 [Kurthia gibsonii]|nr:hypothetical protein [Kurthia gibsonii]
MNIKDEIAANEVLRNIQDKFETQTEKGIAKYGHTVRPESLSVLDWINHTQEELIDALVYLECIQKVYEQISECENLFHAIVDETNAVSTEVNNEDLLRSIRNMAKSGLEIFLRE